MKSFFLSEEKYYLIVRLIFVLTVVIWFVLILLQRRQIILENSLNPNFIFSLILWFSLYSVLLCFLILIFKEKISQINLISIIFDVLFITFLVNYTGGVNSNFSIGYSAIVALHITNPKIFFSAFATTLSLLFYLIVFRYSQNAIFYADFFLRIFPTFSVFFIGAFFVERVEKRKIKESKDRIEKYSNKIETQMEETIQEKFAIKNTVSQITSQYEESLKREQEKKLQLEFFNNLHILTDIEDLIKLSLNYIQNLLPEGEVFFETINKSKSKKIYYSKLTHSKTENNNLLETNFKNLEYKIISDEDLKIKLIVKTKDLLKEEIEDDLNLILQYLSVKVKNVLNESKLQELAITDGLTGLYNHKYFHQRLDEELARVKRYFTDLSLILFDIDNFKQLNDNYGHPIGDKLLLQLSKLVKNTLREVDIFARYGGEEFIIILPETNISGAEIMAERIRKTVESNKFIIEKLPDGEKEEISMTISIGVSSFKEGMKKDELIEFADKSLYMAKRGGKNKVISYK